MTPQTIIDVARSITNDSDSVLYRLSNTELLGYVNDGLKEVSRLMPEYFHKIGDMTCETDNTEQAVTFSNAQELLAVLRIHNGRAVHPMDVAAMSRFNPDWATDTAGAAQNWAKLPDDPLRFYIYPKAPAAQVLDVLYVGNPSVYALVDTITEVPQSTGPALADYVIYRAESRDDEHSNTGRAISHYQSFVQKISGIQPAPPQGA